MRRFALVPALAFLALFALFAWRLLLMTRGDMPNDIKTVLLDQPMPAFQLPALDPGGAAFSSDQLLGHVTLINFFASWCVPCREEHPLLKMLQGRVQLLGVDYKNEPDEAQAWLTRLGNPYDRILADHDGRVGIDFGVYGVPESYLIDRQGRIRYVWKKPFTADEIRQRLLPMIAELEK